MEEHRPDPNKILAAIHAGQTKREGGKLYIFLGMCPGVGKTYAMLQHAHGALAEHKKLLVAVAETHGRGETARLLEGLPTVPLKQVLYRGKTFKEMDLEAVLKARPEIAVVDELAHTNVPGQRHEKRWQDVEELLNNGIDVYTTINIQHVESRKEDAERITGISIHETVPDSLFERANQIELIDLPPEQLIERLNAGNVYLPHNIEFAANNFFQPNKLTALRELSLRFAGDVVGNELDTLHVGMGRLAHKEKILILLYPDQETKKVIRAARKAAFASDGEIYALLMDRNNNLDEKAKTVLLSNAELVRNLNGEVLTSIDTDAFAAIKNIISTYSITRVILRKGHSSVLADIFAGGSLVTRLLNETQVDVHLLRDTSLLGAHSRWDWLKNIYIETNPSRYYRVLLLLALVTALNWVIGQYSGYLAVGFIYLLLVLGVSLGSGGIGPIMVGATGSMLAWNFFFIPPVFTFKISHPDDFVMSLAYLLTAVVTSVLTHKILTNQRLLRQREERGEVMLKIAQALNFSSGDPRETFIYITTQLKRLMPGSFAVVYQTPEGKPQTVNSHALGYGWFESEKEASVSAWSVKNRVSAGWNTDTLSRSEALYIPLYTNDEIPGFLTYMPDDPERKLPVEDMTFLKSAASQMGTYLYKDLLKVRAAKTEKLEEAQKVYQMVLNTVSHELKTPLTVISGAISVLKQNGGDSPESLEDLESAALNLTHEINNILDISKINSNLDVKRDWNDWQDIVYSCLDKLKAYTSAHRIETRFEADLPFVRVNFVLMESALSNLIVNAVNYTPAGSRITLSAYSRNGRVCVEVEDEGCGLPDEELEKIFGKFYRAQQSAGLKSGTGLGLFISRSVAELHGGTVRAEHNRPHGLKVIIELPLEAQPQV